MNKKNVALFLIAVALVAVFFGVKTSQKINATPDFSVQDTSKIQRINLICCKEQIHLVKTPDGWTIDGKEKANEIAMRQMLDVLKLMQTKTAVPSSVELQVREMLLNSTRVEVYDKDGKLIEGFFIGKTTADGNTNYIMKLDEMIPYLVYIPSVKKDLSQYFVPDIKRWRSLQILSLAPGKINKVCITYKDKPKESFCLSKTDEGYFLEGGEKVAAQDGDYYLSNFEDIQVVKYIDDPEFTDSLSRATPDFTIRIETQTQDYTIKGFAKDKNTFSGLLNGQAFEMKYTAIDPVLRYKSDFEVQN